jgi:heat-inducible transcriptional repressor
MLSARQQAILSYIVEHYVAGATPVSSLSITASGSLAVSSATVRNEVSVLEEHGYITHPHSSAGSVPCDKAYRLYVENVAATNQSTEPSGTRDSVRVKLSHARMDAESWSSTAAEELARMVDNLAVATPPRSAESRVRRIELVPLEGLLAMMIVVLEHTRLRRHMLHLTQPTDADELARSANRVRDLVEGHTRRQLTEVHMDLSPLEQDILDTTILVLEQEDKNLFRDHYLDGLRNLLSQPEFAENSRIRELVEGFEDGTLAQAVLEEMPDGATLRVVIGDENRGDVLRPLSVVIGRYGGPGGVAGAIAAVGPTRMRYAHTIARVRLMTSVMSEMVDLGQ